MVTLQMIHLFTVAMFELKRSLQISSITIIKWPKVIPYLMQVVTQKRAKLLSVTLADSQRLDSKPMDS